MKTKIQSIEEVKVQIIDTSLSAASVIGTLAYLVSLSRLFKFGFHISFVINFMVIASVVTITLMRSRMPILVKTYVIIALIILLTLADAFNYGLLSAARLYLILIPFFAILYLPFMQSLVVFICTILCFLVIGYLHHTGILHLPHGYIPNSYMLQMYPWIIIAVHISAIALIILLVIRKFIRTYSDLIADLESLVNERTENLEKANQELTGQREELVTALENLQQAQRQLVQSEKMASLGVLSSGIAHEINNPLNFIYGGMWALENYIDENLPEHREKMMYIIESIREGVTRATRIVKSLSQYSRQDDVTVAQCNIHAVIENCLMILNNQMKFRVELSRDFTREPFTLLCNEGKIHQVILSLLLNASEAIEDKGKIGITTRKEDQQLIVSIEDTGCGIKPEHLPKIMDPFFTTKDPGKGTGLGLSIVYNIVKEHNGKLEFESKPGEGTRVTLTLPLS
jgi:signal transduction histidine kinase